MAKRRTFIPCGLGHVVGEIVYRELHEEKVPALYAYETSLPSEEFATDELPKKRALVIGDAIVECTICRGEVKWSPSSTAVVAVMIDLLHTLYQPAVRKDQVRHEPV
jgi:hypothetical protein